MVYSRTTPQRVFDPSMLLWEACFARRHLGLLLLPRTAKGDSSHVTYILSSPKYICSISHFLHSVAKCME